MPPHAGPGMMALLPLLLCCSTARPQEGQVEVTLRVYDYAGIGTRMLEQARDAARLPFAHAGIELEWWNCGAPPQREAPDPRCHGEVRPEHLQVNLVADTPALQSSRNQLALSFLGRGAAGNTRAYVFADRVRALARQLAAPRALGDVVGYSVAHEVGHLLLGGAHSAGGLMRSSWNVRQMQSALAHILWFHPREGARMREALRRRAVE